MRPDVVINFVLYFVYIHNVTIIKFTYLLTYLLLLMSELPCCFQHFVCADGKLKHKLKSCSKIYGCMDVVYLLKLHDNSGKTSYMYFGYQNRLQSIAAFYNQ